MVAGCATAVVVAADVVTAKAMAAADRPRRNPVISGLLPFILLAGSPDSAAKSTAPLHIRPSDGNHLAFGADGFEIERGGDQRLGIGRLGRLEDLPGRPTLDDLAVAQHDDLVGKSPHDL